MEKIKGVVVRDQWETGCTEWGKGKRYLFRVRDPYVGGYAPKTFNTLKEGYSWAMDMLYELRHRLDTSEKAYWKNVGDEYVDQLRLARRSPKHVADIERVVQALHAAGARDMKAPAFQAIVLRWLQAGKTFARDRVNHPLVSNHTRNRWRQHIRSVVKYAIDSNRMTFNPIRGIRQFTTDQKNKPTFGSLRHSRPSSNSPPTHRSALWIGIGGHECEMGDQSLRARSNSRPPLGNSMCMASLLTAFRTTVASDGDNSTHP